MNARKKIYKVGLLSKRININHFDIYYNPIVDPRFVADEGAQITFGDMHGNTMKFVAQLIKHDILRISAHDQHTLSCIYNMATENLTTEIYEHFCNIINSCEVNPAARKATLRLIGDEFSDRGRGGDQFTIPIFKKLNKEGISWTSCASNHTMELIYCYEIKDPEYKNKILSNQESHACSMLALKKCIKQGIISQKYVDAFIENDYLPHFKVVDFTINEHQELTHYIHAPFDENTIVNLAEQLGVKYNPNSYSELRKSQLHKLQDIFQNDYVKNHTIHTLLDSSATDAFYNCLWNRSRSKLVHHNTKKRYVNGHDYANQYIENVVELDNELGKSDVAFDPDLNPYTALYTHENQEFNNPVLVNADSICIHEDLIPYFGENIAKLIKKSEIYSRFQIATLKRFLTADDALKKWEQIAPKDSDQYHHFIKAIGVNYEIWDVMHLLDKHNLLNKVHFTALIHNYQNAENIYQNLLILESLGLLNTDNNILSILSLNNNDIKDLHDYLIELHQYQRTFKEKIVFNDDIKNIISSSLHLHSYKLRCLNYINLFYSNFTDIVNTKEIADIMLENLKTDVDDDDKIDKLYRLLKEHYKYNNKRINPRDLNRLAENYQNLALSKKLGKLMHFFKFNETASNQLYMTSSFSQTLNNYIEFFEYAFKFRYEINNNIEQLFQDMSRLKIVNQIWLHVKDLESNYFEVIFNNPSLIDVIRICGLIKELQLSPMEHLNDLTELNKSQLISVSKIINLIKTRIKIKYDDINFILQHAENIDHLIILTELYSEKFNSKIWQQLQTDIDIIEQRCDYELKMHNPRDLNFLAENYIQLGSPAKLGALSKHFKFEEECYKLVVTIISDQLLQNNLIGLFEYAYTFQYEINQQICNSFKSLPQLQSISDIWIHVKNLNNNFIGVIFNHGGLTEIIQLYGLAKEIGVNPNKLLDNLSLYFKEDLSLFLEISLLLKARDVFKECDLEFVLNHKNSIPNLITCIKVLDGTFNIGKWEKLKVDVDKIDDKYINSLKPKRIVNRNAPSLFIHNPTPIINTTTVQESTPKNLNSAVSK